MRNAVATVFDDMTLTSCMSICVCTEYRRSEGGSAAEDNTPAGNAVLWW